MYIQAADAARAGAVREERTASDTGVAGIATRRRRPRHLDDPDVIAHIRDGCHHHHVGDRFGPCGVHERGGAGDSAGPGVHVGAVIAPPKHLGERQDGCPTATRRVGRRLPAPTVDAADIATTIAAMVLRIR
jgi:hypothetical protein